MAVLWCGGEDVDFPLGDAPTVSTNPVQFRAGYARCALTTPGVSKILALPIAAPVTNFWLSARVLSIGNPLLMVGLANSGAVGSGLYVSSALNSVNASDPTKLALIRYSNPGTWAAGTPYVLNQIVAYLGAYTQRVTVAGTSGGSPPAFGTLPGDVTVDGSVTWVCDGQFYGGTQIATEAGHTYTSNVLHKVDLQVSSYGASATVNVYLNGVLTITFTGNAASFGVTNLDQAAIFTPIVITGMYVSEVIVSSSSTLTQSLVTLAPNAAGTTSGWAGAYTDVNEITIDDSAAVSTNTPGLNEQFNLIDLPAGSWTIRAVKVAARAEVEGAATATTVALGINSGGTVNAGAAQALTTAWATYERLMLVNPITGVAFTTAEINALQSNLRSG
jgi:hypothetical protein